MPTLVTNFIARTSSFQNGVNKNLRSLNRFSGQINKTQRNLANFARVVVAVAGVYGIGRLGKSLIDTASIAEETQ